jgi:CIC family chloride channel protein
VQLRDLIKWIRPNEPLELQIAGRTLLHAALVGLGAGIVGCVFFAATDLLYGLLLERLAGYEPLHAHGENVVAIAHGGGELHYLLLAILPALGALVAGVITRFAPECRGGGGDAAIEAFHHGNGEIRRRVLFVKSAASIVTLGTGGSGGREGPTMQIGAALGSTCGRYLRVSPRERRVLMVAGIAAGISAVFRTPLGASLIAIEMLYRDDFEAEALVPGVLASVVAYSVSITVFGQSTMFGHLAPHPFIAKQLPLYVLFAVLVAAGGSMFVGALRGTQRIARRIRIEWLRPVVGGLALGVLVVAIVHYLGPVVGRGDRGVGALGGGYGAAQVAISGSSWLPISWAGVEILLFLALVKIVATSCTIGFGGSAGDFAPALTVGALLGGAFGLAAQIALDDPTIQPGAFALVGMGALYGGIANTPLAAVVMVCEMAGSYDLLVPLMLVQGLTFVLLRRTNLYPAQVRNIHQSPVHRRDPFGSMCVRDVVRRDRPFVTLGAWLRLPELLPRIEQAADQDVFPVVDELGALRGVIAAESLRVIATNPELHRIALAVDLMRPAHEVGLEDRLRPIAETMVDRDLRAVPVVDGGMVVALLDQHDIAKAAARDPNESMVMSRG